ncbi:ribbon-helix-helix protein, CopG family [Novosphingobium beihaiensis]|uniref:Ribbon-helix-helix domain-containing protein n=1 Tax=Novosphingobium beihaiensis TaxID=2930389 RepID=A0ABT0BUX0_9SPHN|nr:ribbon-helix-helix protein, CopG family [Novosphingobium beihaiensis]MCJ2188596.1 ribbon-helix-helix domain-containing protein [Novosphingobium beihaiensis]
MGQVNVTYDDALLRRLDGLAEQLGQSRPDLLRALAEEAVKAHEQGRPMFEPPAAPIDAAAAMGLALKVEQLSIDLDRLARSWDRREKKLVKAFNATEDANRDAQVHFSHEMIERFRDGSMPFLRKIVEVRQLIAELKDDVLAATREPASLAAIRADLAAMKTAMRRSRRQFHFHFGRDWTFEGWQLGALSLSAVAALMVGEILLATVLPYRWLATPLSLKLFGSADAGICELYAQSRHLDRCPVLAPEKTGGEP